MLSFAVRGVLIFAELGRANVFIMKVASVTIIVALAMAGTFEELLLFLDIQNTERCRDLAVALSAVSALIAAVVVADRTQTRGMVDRACWCY